MIYFVIPTNYSTSLPEKIERELAGRFYKLPRGEYLVTYDGTSKSLSDMLNVTDGSGGHALIGSMSGYWGYAPNDLWEWIKANWEKAS